MSNVCIKILVGLLIFTTVGCNNFHRGYYFDKEQNANEIQNIKTAEDTYEILGDPSLKVGNKWIYYGFTEQHRNPISISIIDNTEFIIEFDKNKKIISKTIIVNDENIAKTRTDFPSWDIKSFSKVKHTYREDKTVLPCLN
ncbi:MAG: hypothetical protein JJV93_00080 [Alphaproteobacteria bacterium]|nr:hypothetical protein [Alphaproteobacteria bacterium]MBL0717653.1 hypothetical protein [Alphaproteobacteria bacterium]